jgi:hypothetical protein
MEEITVPKAKFDHLLGRMLATPPLPKSEVSPKKPKAKRKKK